MLSKFPSIIDYSHQFKHDKNDEILTTQMIKPYEHKANKSDMDSGESD